MRDGCGPLGRHLTGATGWQKCYGVGLYSTALIVPAGVDVAIPVPPPSEDLSVDAISFYISIAGDATSLMRTALYDMEVFPGGTLLAEAAEFAPIAVGTQTRTFGAVTLKRNGRYAILICSSGLVLPTIYAGTPATMSWMGTINYGVTVAQVNYTRAYGAFPAIYNGVYSTYVPTTRFCTSLRLP
jgi:hypothetical protein